MVYPTTSYAHYLDIGVKRVDTLEQLQKAGKLRNSWATELLDSWDSWAADYLDKVGQLQKPGTAGIAGIAGRRCQVGQLQNSWNSGAAVDNFF